eukprot:GHVS01027651.1.p1 GENE.GHVS01027651.1~~GHVS01027651.1.p1  ORF type:complete len:357 (+),score=60.85 GHVS01027651.1:60-1130(+)
MGTSQWTLNLMRLHSQYKNQFSTRDNILVQQGSEVEKLKAELTRLLTSLCDKLDAIETNTDHLYQLKAQLRQCMARREKQAVLMRENEASLEMSRKEAERSLHRLTQLERTTGQVPPRTTSRKRAPPPTLDFKFACARTSPCSLASARTTPSTCSPASSDCLDNLPSLEDEFFSEDSQPGADLPTLAGSAVASGGGGVAKEKEMYLQQFDVPSRYRPVPPPSNVSVEVATKVGASESQLHTFYRQELGKRSLQVQDNINTIIALKADIKQLETLLHDNIDKHGDVRDRCAVVSNELRTLKAAEEESDRVLRDQQHAIERSEQQLLESSKRIEQSKAERPPQEGDTLELSVPQGPCF